METASASNGHEGRPDGSGIGWLKAVNEKSKAKVVEVTRMTWKLGQDDPRRIVHSLKVGLAITLVSFLYYFDPFFKGYGVSAMWAVMTVVVVFEFSVGATLGRGVNRALATLLAGALGLGAHHLASFSGEDAEPILLGLFVFLLAAVVSFVRFFPRLKARYDYGLMIFILTFSLITVSGYRDEEVLEMAHERLSTILIGCFAALFVCMVICPVWAGDDLHNMTANNIEKLGCFLQGFGSEYFKESGDRESTDSKEIMLGYKSVLNSKQSEESLVNFARWEPAHGRFSFRHPWKQYLKIGSLTRHCAYRIEALNGYLNSDMQTPPEVRSRIKDASTKLSSESGNALKELASTIKKMTRPSLAEQHIANSKTAAENLKSLLEKVSWEDINVLELVPVATVASLLIEIVACTEKIAESVNELGSLAKFKNVATEQRQPHQKRVVPFPDNDAHHHHVITVAE